MPSEIFCDLVMKAFKIGNLKREKKAPTGIRIISVAWQSASCPWCLSVRHRMPSLYMFLISLGISEILSRTICQQLKTSNGRMIKFSGSGMERLSSVGDCHCPRKFGELAKVQRAHFIGKAHGHMPRDCAMIRRSLSPKSASIFAWLETLNRGMQKAKVSAFHFGVRTVALI